MGKTGHLVWRMSGVGVVDVLCGGGPILHAVWWMSSVVDVWRGGSLCGGCRTIINDSDTIFYFIWAFLF